MFPFTLAGPQFIVFYVIAAIIVGALAVVALSVMPRLTFDFDPLKLKDPTSESMSAILEIMDDPWATPNTLSILTPSPEAARVQRSGSRCSQTRKSIGADGRR